MDKYEYKVRADEIKQLIAQGNYAQAAEIADTIDWRRVKSVMMLCTISDLYKINRRYEDARDMLLLAYERRPGGRTICYSLCELSIKTEEYVQAVEYYKEFVQAAPSDPGRYILQYKIYEAQEVSLEERIEVLEELKKRDYREKWAYELAYLYHRVGLATRCVEECDELILWFGEGRYVIKAMELKMLHQPLTPEQQERYDHRFDVPQERNTADYPTEEGYQTEGYQTEEYQTGEEASGDYQTAGYQTAGYQTGEDQAGEEPAGEYPAEMYPGEEYPAEESAFSEADQQELQNTRIYDAGGYGSQDRHTQEEAAWQEDREKSGPENQSGQEAGDESDIHVKTMDLGQYNTLNLQAELAAGLREVLEEEKNDETYPDNTPAEGPTFDSETESLDSIQIEESDEDDFEPETEEIESSEVFFGETGEIGDLQQVMEASAGEEAVREESVREESVGEKAAGEKRISEEQVMTAQPPKELAGVLAQESDGQISLVLPESSHLEKQITGQMSIEDILTEWERMKQQNQQKREQEVRKHVLEHTGDMFTEFEASVRDGLLEKLEKDEGIEEAGTTPEDGVEELEDIQDDADSGTGEGFYEEYEEEPEETFEEDYEQEEPEEPKNDEGKPDRVLRKQEENAPQGEDEFQEEDELQEEDEFQEVDKSREEDELQEGATQEENTPQEKEEALREEAVLLKKGGHREAEKEEQEEIYENPGEDSGREQKDISEADKKRTKDTRNKIEMPKAQTGVILTKEFLEDDEEEVVREKEKIRSLTREEKELYAPYIQSKASREQLVKAIDNISMASYTGNLVITGEEGMDTLSLAKNVVREIQASDSNFSGKVAKISGHNLNKKDVAETLEQLRNGALIIEKSSELEPSVIQKLYQTLQKENMGIVVILADTKKRMNRLLSDNEKLKNVFTARIDVEALSNDALVAFGRQYAKELEFSIDDLGILALHTRIESLQTSDHIVTVLEVKEIVDEAIAHAKRKTLGHFFDILVAKRYDEEDMIILSEKDFV